MSALPISGTADTHTDIQEASNITQASLLMQGVTVWALCLATFHGVVVCFIREDSGHVFNYPLGIKNCLRKLELVHSINNCIPRVQRATCLS